MALPYDRKFNVGRQSEQLYNEELHKIYESIKHLLDMPENKHSTPEAKLDGSIWLDRRKNELMTYVQSSKTWIPIFKSKFQIVDQITNILPPDNPVLGQLWLYNDVLMYWNGSEWKPVKALEQDGSQFNLAIFENFLLVSPILTREDIISESVNANKINITAAQVDKLTAQYEQNKIDLENNSSTIKSEKWLPGTQVATDSINLDALQMMGDTKILVPNMNVDRIFLDREIDFSYKELNAICIQYPTQTITDKRPSLIHVNPGKLTRIEKTVIKIDRENPKIEITAADTEYYGFHGDSPFGDLLLPEAEQDDGGYIKMSDGIFLNTMQAQNYDYVLAIHYTFNWFKSTGQLKKATNHDSTASFYIQDYAGPMTVFTDGYNLEETSFEEDNLSKVITVNENLDDIEDVSMIHTVRREYGFVRKIDIQNRAVIKVLRPYIKPLIYLNGEAIHPQLNDVEIDGQTMYVSNGQLNMVWGVVELYDEVHKYDMSLDVGYVRDTNDIGEVIITYDTSKIDEDDSMIVYIDGLLVKKEDIVRDHTAGTIKIEGLQAGQDYILLRDKYHYFYDEDKIYPAIPIGHLSESLVYVNGNLINNNTSVITAFTKEQEKITAVNNEVKFFYDGINVDTGEYYIYNDAEDTWLLLSERNINEIKAFCYSYENTVRAIKFNMDTDKTDDVRIFAFNYANAIDEPLIIRNIPSILDDPNNPNYVENQKRFIIKESYIPNIGSLSVYVNGLRQYNVTEFEDGSGFELPEAVTGVVTYVIERPENGATTVAQREILTDKNVVHNAVNVYKTTKPMYPGRVLFYINGIRQPQSAFTILDNYTFLINDQNTMPIGNDNNYPDWTILKDNKPVVIHPDKADQILVEVKQDFDRQENYIQLDKDTAYDISISKYNLPIEILEAGDEIMIYVDGLFMGLRKSFGYELDRNRGVISLGVRRDVESPDQDKTETTNIDVINRILGDPMYEFYESHPDKKLEYMNKHDGKPYERKTRNIIFDWR